MANRKKTDSTLEREKSIATELFRRRRSRSSRPDGVISLVLSSRVRDTRRRVAGVSHFGDTLCLNRTTK